MGFIVPYHICGSQPKQLEVLKSCRIRVDAKCHAFYLCVTKHGSNQVVSAVIPVMFKPEPEQVKMVKVATNQSIRQAAASLTAWKKEMKSQNSYRLELGQLVKMMKGASTPPETSAEASERHKASRSVSDECEDSEISESSAAGRKT